MNPTSSPSQNQPRNDYNWLYWFSDTSDINKAALGSKGAEQREMASAHLSVLPGFTITAQARKAYHELGERLPDEVWDHIVMAVHRLEVLTGRRFADSSNPLLVNLCPSSSAAMPGTMKTISDVGLNDATVKGLAKITQNEHSAYLDYIQFIQTFASAVFNIPIDLFENRSTEMKEQAGVFSTAV